MAENFPIQPLMTTDGVPCCAYEACGSYDGKRCRASGFRPGRICEPAVQDTVAPSPVVNTQEKAISFVVSQWCPIEIEVTR